MDSKHGRDFRRHDADSYSSSESDLGTDQAVQHLEPLPLLALSHHRCDSVLLQAFNQMVTRINLLQQTIDELCDHLYVQNDDEEDDYPTEYDDDEEECAPSHAQAADDSVSNSDDDNDDDDDTDDADDQTTDDGTLQGDMPDEVALSADDLVAETLLELAAFAVTPKNRRQRLLGRGNRPR